MDEKIFKLINRQAGRYPILDALMIFFSKRIRYVFLFVLFFLWLRGHSGKKTVLHTMLSVLISWIIQVFLQSFYFKARPYRKHSANVLIPSKPTSSFPSKHTILAFSASTSVYFHKRILGLILSVLSALTGLSRIWVGHHYPSDIIGSTFIGCFTGIAMNKISSLFSLSRRPFKN